MPKKKGVAHIRSGLAAAIDSDTLTPPEPDPTPSKTPTRKRTNPSEPSAEPVEAAGLRGTARAGQGETIEKVTITLPSSVIRAADELVFERKRQARAYNRSALIQEALQAYLDAPRKD